MLHEIVATIASNGCNIAPILLRCSALKIAVANRQQSFRITSPQIRNTKGASVGVGNVLVLLQSGPTWLRSARSFKPMKN